MPSSLVANDRGDIGRIMHNVSVPSLDVYAGRQKFQGFWVFWRRILVARVQSVGYIVI